MVKNQVGLNFRKIAPLVAGAAQDDDTFSTDGLGAEHVIGGIADEDKVLRVKLGILNVEALPKNLGQLRAFFTQLTEGALIKIKLLVNAIMS